MAMIQTFLKNDSGATASEYALVIAFLVVSLMASLGLASTNIKTALTSASGKL